MKIFATIFLISTIFLQTFSSYIIKADFFLNRDFISKTLCVNVEKPMMHCNGKCYLTKKLKEQQKQDQSPVSRTEKFDVQPFFIPSVPVINKVISVSAGTFFIEDENLVSSFPGSIFHPPSA
jgi:hypothetical protein